MDNDGLAPRVTRILLGIFFIVLPVALVIMLYGIWPCGPSVPGHNDAPAPFFGTTWNPVLDHRLMLVVLTTGALGSYVHAATSYASYVGNGQLHQTWVWWYVLRGVIGSVLALVFYFVIRGGLLTANGGAADLNPFGVAAIAGLVGMFSKQATDKLRETFDNLFRTAPGTGDAQRADKLRPVPPEILQIIPQTLAQGTPALTLQINGANFIASSIVKVGGTDRVTRFVSSTSLEADLAPSDVQNIGVLSVIVQNSGDAGGSSASVSLPVN
jgi:hypothetical protein